MHPKSLQLLSSLRPGDRLHFTSDPTKHVWEIVPAPVRTRTINKGRRNIITSEIELKDDNGKRHWAKISTQVIFLRHAQTPRSMPGTGRPEASHATLPEVQPVSTYMQYQKQQTMDAMIYTGDPTALTEWARTISSLHSVPLEFEETNDTVNVTTPTGVISVKMNDAAICCTKATFYVMTTDEITAEGWTLVPPPSSETAS